MYVIIVFDPDSCEFKEVLGPFDSWGAAASYARLDVLENVIVTAVLRPDWSKVSV